jgi:hypothetical protein
MAAFYPINPASKNGIANNVSVATNSTAVASSAFGSQTYQIRIAATAACNYLVDSTTAATASDALLPLNWVEYVKVTPGQKISVYSPTIQTISVTEIVG